MRAIARTVVGKIKTEHIAPIDRKQGAGCLFDTGKPEQAEIHRINEVVCSRPQTTVRHLP
jgi:hypothetical protein